MKFPRNMAPFVILDSDQPVRQLSEFLGLVEHFSVSAFKFHGPGANLGFQCVGQRAKPLLAFPKRLFGAFLSGDVPRYLRSPDEAALRVFYRRYGQGNIQHTAVFAHAYRFEMLQAFASFEPVKNHRLFGSAVGRNNERDVASDGFFGGVAEESFRSFVLTGYYAVALLAGEPFVPGTHECGQVLEAILGFTWQPTWYGVSCGRAERMASVFRIAADHLLDRWA